MSGSTILGVHSRRPATAVSYYAHFDHPQRCPVWLTDEVDRQAAQEPALVW
jgi:hypothetical protein